MTDEHKVEIHENPLNDGTSWYRVICSCGYANPEQLEGGRRIYSIQTAELVRDKHLEDKARG